jgi:hypothetical protein
MGFVEKVKMPAVLSARIFDDSHLNLNYVTTLARSVTGRQTPLLQHVELTLSR